MSQNENGHHSMGTSFVATYVAKLASFKVIDNVVNYIIIYISSEKGKCVNYLSIWNYSSIHV